MRTHDLQASRSSLPAEESDRPPPDDPRQAARQRIGGSSRSPGQQGFAACANAQVRRAVRRAFGQLWGEVARVSGLAPLKVKAFIAYGMLLDDLASMDVDRVDEAWARDGRTPVPIETFR